MFFENKWRNLWYLMLTFSPNLDGISDDSARYYSKKYLDVGESVFDYTSAYFGSSDYFKRS